MKKEVGKKMENDHTYTRQEISQMSPEQYEKHRPEIMKQMSEGKIR